MLVILAFFGQLSSVAQQSKKVLIIAVDGCRPDALEVASTPNFDALISNGIYSPDALNDDITVTGPGWSAALAGVWSNKHLVTDNSFLPNDFATYPSLFRRAEESNPDLATYSICSWAPINDFIVQDHADVVVSVPLDVDVIAEAPDYLTNVGPDLSLVYFDGVDDAGHDHGFSPNEPAYLAAIEVIDDYVGELMSAIEARPAIDQEDWMIIVTTDHGGRGTEHGGSSIEEENIFMIVSGNSIDEKLIVKDCSNVFDSTYDCLQNTYSLSFTGDGDRVSIQSSGVFDFGSNQDFTVECRVRTEESADVAIVGNKDWDSAYNPGFVFSFAFPNGPAWKVNIADGTERADFNSGGEIADGEWHTLCVTFDRDGDMTMYEDGALVGSEDISAIGNINSGAGLSFGADIFGAYAYTGAISEVRIWDTVLSAPVVSSWYCDTITSDHPNYNNLVGYWHMNEGFGNAVTFDHSGLTNNGTLLGAEWSYMDSTSVCNYDSTPRLPDVFPTAFAHLCIPIVSVWNLDGQSLVPACNQASVDNRTTNSDVEIWPNPTSGAITIRFDGMSEESTLRLYNSLGELLRQSAISNGETIIQLPITEGIYVLELIDVEGNRQLKRLVRN